MKTSPNNLWLSVDNFFNNKESQVVVGANFGVKGRVATYFCRKTIISGEHSRRGTSSFNSWLSYSLSDKFQPQLVEAKNRVKAQMEEMRWSQAYADAEQAFLAECAIRDIKTALAAYKHLGDDMLKQAIREFLCDDVFEFVDS